MVRGVVRACVVLGLAGAFGAARAELSVKPRLSVSLEERYDDDVLFRDPAVTPIGAELMTKLIPKGGIQVRDRTLEADAWYAPDLQLRHFSGTFRIDHRAGLTLDKELSERLQLHAEGALWRVADPTSLPRVGVGRTLSPVLYGTGELGLVSRLTRRLSLDAEYRFEGARIYAPGFEPSQMHQPSAELLYRLTPRTTLGTEYRFQYFLYGPKQSVGHSPAALYRYRLSRQLTFTARGGAVWFQPVFGADGRTGVAPRVHLQLDRAVPGFDLGVQVGQDVLGATGFSDALWAQYASVYTAVRVSDPFRLYGAAYGYRNGDAPGGPAQWLGRLTTPSQGYGLGGGAEWRFDRNWMVQVQLDRVVQVANAPDLAVGAEANLSRNIAAVRLVVTPW